MQTKEQTSCDVIGLGTVVVDHQVVLPEFPCVDTKHEITADRYQVGGPVPTALAMLRRFGKQCSFIGKWADDSFGQMIAEDFRKTGIESDHSVVFSEGRTGFAHVWIDQSTGSRTVAYCRGDLGEIAVREIENCDFSNCRVLHLDGWSGEAAKFAAEKAKAFGAKIVLDAGSPKPGTEALLPLVDVINCPTRFAHEFYGIDSREDAARRLLDSGVGTAVFTNGSAGATCYGADGSFHTPAFAVNATDTTGAGDVFCGGVIYGILEGLDLRLTIRIAAACAALKCQSLGNPCGAANARVWCSNCSRVVRPTRKHSSRVGSAAFQRHTSLV